MLRRDVSALVVVEGDMFCFGVLEDLSVRCVMTRLDIHHAKNPFSRCGDLG